MPSNPDTASNTAMSATPFAVPSNRTPAKWLILGPFENAPAEGPGPRPGMRRDHLTSIGGEAEARLTAGTLVPSAGRNVETREVAAVDGFIDLFALYKQDTDFKVAYAYAELESAEATELAARFGSDDAAFVWVNGELVHRSLVDRAVDPNSDRFGVRLQPGRNRILIKVDNAYAGWGFSLRLFDHAGEATLRAREHRQHLERFEVAPLDGEFLIEGSALPELGFRRGARDAARVFADRPLRVRWFGPDEQEVASADRPGGYTALVEAETLDGYTARRMLTFAKTPPGTLPWYPPRPDSNFVAPLPEGFELNAAQQRELSRHFWVGGTRAMAQGEDAAILAVELLDRAGSAALPSALESGHIRNLERQLALRLRLERRQTKPLSPPALLDKPAGTLRYGTEIEAGMKAGSVAELRRVADAWAEADEHGFVVLLARKGVVFLHEGFNGFARDSRFWPASTGKTIAGLLIGRAVDQGLIGLDDPLANVLPELHAARERLPEAARALTLRHCFYHVAGFSGHVSHGGLFNAYLDNALIVQDLAFAEPLRRFVYNGDDLNLAGKVVELITGQSVFRLLHEHLEKPFEEPVSQFDLGSGAEFSATYLAKLGQMIAQDGAYANQRFFSPGFLKQLWPRRVCEYVPDFPDASLENGIGLTWMIDPPGPREKGVLGPNVIGHGAASGVTWRIAPDHELVIVVGRNGFRDWGENERWSAKLAAAVARCIA